MTKVNFDNITISYEVRGEGSAVLLLHGLGSSGADWMFQVPALKDYQVITCDMRGHGESSKPPAGYSLELFARDIANLLTHLNLPPVHVVGLSLGSFVALQLACDYPQLVRSVTLVGVTCRMHNLGRYRLLFRKWLQRLLPMSVTARIVARALFPHPSQQALCKVCTKRIASNKKSIYSKIFAEILDFDLSSRVSHIRCPVLVVVGSDDHITPPEEAEKLVQQLPHARLAIIEKSGHACPLDAPEVFNAHLVHFFSQG